MHRRNFLSTVASLTATAGVAGRTTAHHQPADHGGNTVPAIEEHGEDYMQYVTNHNGWATMINGIHLFDSCELILGEHDDIQTAPADRWLSAPASGQFAAVLMLSMAPEDDGEPGPPPDTSRWKSSTNDSLSRTESNPPITVDDFDAEEAHIRVGDYDQQLWGTVSEYGNVFGTPLFTVPENERWVAVGADREGSDELAWAYSINVDES